MITVRRHSFGNYGSFTQLFSPTCAAYFRVGMNFLGTGEEVRSFWDTFIGLLSTLRQREIERGIAVIARYRDLAGASYEDVWTIKPTAVRGRSAGRG
jgi:hypothetical protein